MNPNRYRIVAALKLASEKGKEVGALRNRHTGCLCFQGVIVDEYLKEHGGEWIGGFGVWNEKGYLASAWAPQRMLDWSGFSEEEIARYTSLNDDEQARLSLAQLARVIEHVGASE